MRQASPERPVQTSMYALACLDQLVLSGLGRWISLGGAFGLAHYLEYRSTHDVDAWWTEEASAGDRSAVIAALEQALGGFGEAATRRWGDVASVELRVHEKTVFTFQIAARSARLAAPMPSSWPGIGVDALEDLVASKMVALVERGAPRDLLDIYELNARDRCTPDECWTLWAERQRLAREDEDRERARLAVRTHLARIAAARPLATIAEPEARAAAQRIRRWYDEDFLA